MTESARCRICSDPELRERVDALSREGVGYRKIWRALRAEGIQIGRSAVQTHVSGRCQAPRDALGQRAGVGQPPGVAKNVSATKGPEVTTDKDGGTFTTGPLDRPLELATHWDDLLRSYGLDPDIFEVADDTVRMSKWQQSKGTEDGSRDVIWLYSYSARFTRKKPTLADVIDLDEMRRYVRTWGTKRAPSRAWRTGNAAPCTFVVGWADWQLGKSAGGGVKATVAKIRESFELAAARLEELRAAGRNIEHVAVLNMGDPTESCYGQYASQLFTVELNQRDQLNLCSDLWLEGVRILQPDIFASVLCNHGEWTRTGAGERPVTSDSDNVSGYLADTLFRVLDGRPENPITEWHIPHDNMVTHFTLSGVPVAATHGHKIPSQAKEREWLRDQSTLLLRREHIDPRIWLTAHYHHLRVDDMGAWWRIQHPTLDGGSKWFEDTTGQWSTPGTATYLIGQHDVRGWSDLAVLGTTPGVEEVA